MIPSLLAVSAVHHHLISVQKRVQTALVVETGEMREVMHAALLLGYGASAINPYMAFAILDDLVDRQEIQLNYETAEKNYVKAICKGLFKVMSKMGISTIRSYRGAKLFEAIGLSRDLADTYFGGTTSNIGGIRLEEIAQMRSPCTMTHSPTPRILYWNIKAFIPSARMARNTLGTRIPFPCFNWLPAWGATRNSRNIPMWLMRRKAPYSCVTS